MFPWLRVLQDSLSIGLYYRTMARKRSLELKTNTAPVDIKNSSAKRAKILYMVSVKV